MSQLIGILLFHTFCPSFYQGLEGLQFRQRSLGQIQVEHDGLLNDLPQTDLMLVGRLYNLAYRRIADATCRIVDDASQRLLVIGIDHHTEIGDDILYLLALIEAQSAINPIRDTVLAHLLFERTALRIGTIENGKIREFTMVLSAQAFDIITNYHRLLFITIGRLQRQLLTDLVLAEHFLTNLPLVLLD